MIDNTEFIKDFLKRYPKKYKIDIIEKRDKEQICGIDYDIITTYEINSLSEYEQKINEIKKFCNEHNHAKMLLDVGRFWVIDVNDELIESRKVSSYVNFNGGVIIESVPRKCGYSLITSHFDYTPDAFFKVNCDSYILIYG